MKSKSSKIDFPIECRFSPLWWLMVPLATGMAVFAVMAVSLSSTETPEPKHTDWLSMIVGGLMALFFMCCGIGIVLELLFAVIRADEQGLSWRRPFSSWKSVRWEEITDYHRSLSNNHVIITPAGKLTLDSQFYEITRITDLVVEKTPHIKRAGWEMKGTRSDEDWSRTFTPWSADQKWQAPVITTLPVLLIILCTAEIINEPARNQPYLGFWMDTFPRIVGGLLAALALGVCVWMLRESWSDRRYASNHRDEKLVLNAQGLTFTSRDHNCAANWAEIERVTLLPEKNRITPLQVETARGNLIVWYIINKRYWFPIKLIFDQYIPHAMKSVEADQKERLLHRSDQEGERGAWSGGVIGVGARRWSYQTDEVHFVLLLASFGLLCLPLIYPLRIFVSQEEETIPLSWPLFLGSYFVSSAIMVALWYWYRRTEILADEEGIEKRSPFQRSYRVAWKDVEGIGTDSSGEFVRFKGGKLYITRILKPVRVEELRAYIKQQIMSDEVA